LQRTLCAPYVSFTPVFPSHSHPIWQVRHATVGAISRLATLLPPVVCASLFTALVHPMCAIGPSHRIAIAAVRSPSACHARVSHSHGWQLLAQSGGPILAAGVLPNTERTVAALGGDTVVAVRQAAAMTCGALLEQLGGRAVGLVRPSLGVTRWHAHEADRYRLRFACAATSALEFVSPRVGVLPPPLPPPPQPATALCLRTRVLGRGSRRRRSDLCGL
jgi:hypothetical protein